MTLGGRRLAIRRPSARALVGEELSLASFGWAAGADPLNQATLAAIAAGVSTRRYRTTLDALPGQDAQCSVSRSAVSRRFVALSAQRLDEWLSRDLSELDLAVILVDGVHFRDRVVLIALGIDTKDEKHVLGLREGSTENTTVVRALLADLVDRKLDPERPGCGRSTAPRRCAARSAICSAKPRSCSAARSTNCATSWSICPRGCA